MPELGLAAFIARRSVRRLTFIPALLFLSISGFPLGDASAARPVDIRKFGAVGDGISNDTEAFEAAAKAGAPIFISRGTYVVSKSISLPSGASWSGEGAKSQVVTSGSLAFSVFTAVGLPEEPVTHLRIKGISFRGAAGAFAMDFKSVQGVEIIRCVARELGLLRVTVNLPINIWGGAFDPSAAAGLTKEEQLNQRIWVEESECIRTDFDKKDKTGAIDLRFVRFATVQGCKVAGYYHGIKWWGGDCNFKRGGHPDNERWCRDINIRDNTVSDVSGAGIWGSMGKRILVEGNTVERCGDVGIDFEGCLYSEARDNAVRDARNGCLSIFYVSRDIVFRNNECRTRGAPLMRIYNARPDSSWSTGLRLEGNRFINEGNGLAQVGDYTGSCADASIVGNHLENATMAFASKYTVRPRIYNNTLVFRNVTQTRYAALSVSSATGPAEVAGNTIMVKDSPGEGNTGIRTFDVRPLGERSYLISGNTVSGFKFALRSSSEKTANPPLRLKVRNNRFLSGALSFPGLKFSQLTWSGNRNTQGPISAVEKNWFE